MNFQSSPEQLTILSDANAPVNQYRIRRGNLEFRALDAQGHRFPFSRWRTLTAREIALHSSLNTPVAEWLNTRLLNRATLLGEAVELPGESLRMLLKNAEP